MPEETSSAVAEQSQSAPSQSESGAQQVYDHRIGQDANGDGAAARESEINGEKPSAPKPLSRYERTKRERAAFRAERDAFMRERNAFMQQRAAEAQAAQAEQYTAADIIRYLPGWKRDAEANPWDTEKQHLVESAQKELERFNQIAEAERQARTVEMPALGSAEHRAQWEAAERDLYQADPEFMRQGTRLDTLLRQIMAGSDGNVYRSHPRGIIAAYHRAKMELLEADLKELRTTNSKLETDLKRYQGFTSIGAGAPARPGSGGGVENVSDFARLSVKDQRKHLLANADKHGVPWF